MTDDTPQKEPRQFGLSGGDIGVIGIALLFLFAGLYLFFGPSPLKGLFGPPKPPVSTGEVSVSLPEAKPIQQTQP